MSKEWGDKFSVKNWSDGGNADPLKDIENLKKQIQDNADSEIGIQDIGYCHGTFHLKDYYSENEAVCFGI